MFAVQGYYSSLEVLTNETEVFLLERTNDHVQISSDWDNRTFEFIQAIGLFNQCWH